MSIEQTEVMLYVQEHLGPLRERVGALEGHFEHASKEIVSIKVGLDQLRDRVDHVKEVILEADRVAHSELYGQLRELAKAQQALRNLLRYITASAGALVLIIQVLNHLGVIGR